MSYLNEQAAKWEKFECLRTAHSLLAPLLLQGRLAGLVQPAVLGAAEGLAVARPARLLEGGAAALAARQGPLQRLVRLVLDGAGGGAAGRADGRPAAGAGGARPARDLADGAQPGRVHGALREGAAAHRDGAARRAGRQVPRLRQGPALQGEGVLQEADRARHRGPHLHQQQARPEGGRHRPARVGQEEPGRPQGAGEVGPTNVLAGDSNMLSHFHSPRYYEKLHDWEKALKIYAEKAAEAPDDPDVALGRMRCLEKLGEWGDLHAVAEAQWQVYSTCFGGRLRSLCAHYHHVAGGGRRDQEQDGADGGLGLMGQAGVERDGALRAAAATGEPGRRLLPRRALRAPPAVDGGAGADRPDEGPPRHRGHLPLAGELPGELLYFLRKLPNCTTVLGDPSGQVLDFTTSSVCPILLGQLKMW